MSASERTGVHSLSIRVKAKSSSLNVVSTFITIITAHAIRSKAQ